MPGKSQGVPLKAHGGLTGGSQWAQIDRHLGCSKREVIV